MKLTRALMPAAATFFVALSVACGGGTTESPAETLAVTTGSSTGVVTDTVAIALSENERDKLIDKCEKVANVPGTVEGCLNGIPLDGPPCTRKNHWCLEISASGNAGVLRVRDQQSDASCDEADSDLCDGVEVSAKAIEPMVRAIKSGRDEETAPPTTSSAGSGEPEETGDVSSTLEATP